MSHDEKLVLMIRTHQFCFSFSPHWAFLFVGIVNRFVESEDLLRQLDKWMHSFVYNRLCIFPSKDQSITDVSVHPNACFVLVWFIIIAADLICEGTDEAKVIKNTVSSTCIRIGFSFFWSLITLYLGSLHVIVMKTWATKKRRRIEITIFGMTCNY